MNLVKEKIEKTFQFSKEELFKIIKQSLNIHCLTINVWEQNTLTISIETDLQNSIIIKVEIRDLFEKSLSKSNLLSEYKDWKFVDFNYRSDEIYYLTLFKENFPN
jgi:hypothetical protein